ncbi:NAD+ synthase [Halapricum hydrolyticum]|uniref:NH(3)-dependent NAD(+) synthetase n=1 Tax=Halapricum hydrolyticum TaxID=2979991 RepID=A0AAE3LFR0_9EURY|nr:NAD+ synthase [Halapricum hydrolyticum]MCU4718892.1 NAD+ synthase [Halapricum hydrolyticum]MCU4727830.1 NAD+ synthase [Halapricum hydrolyticum]
MTDDDTIAQAEDPLNLSLSEAELEDRHEHLTGFIREQVEAAGTDKAVVAISGGVDSGLVAGLAADALGPERVHGLVMPSEVNADETMSDAVRVAEQFELPHDVIEVGPIIEGFLDAYPEGRQHRMAAGNVRVRTRAVLNYLVANTENGLVVGTGNRTEALIGYFTKYGDGAVDCHPIANLYKQQVRQLARHVGVPESVASRTPTAGMWVGQTDAEELGIEYDTLDSILALHVEGGVPVSATAREIGVDETVVERVRALHEHSSHKRQVPPGPAEPY